MNDSNRMKEIRERERKATKGPWIVASGDDEYCSSIFGVISEAENNRVEADTSIRRGDFPADTKWIAVDPGTAPVQFAEDDNFDFIAHARADVPFLLSAYAAVEKERDSLRHANGNLAESLDKSQDLNISILAEKCELKARLASVERVVEKIADAENPEHMGNARDALHAVKLMAREVLDGPEPAWGDETTPQPPLSSLPADERLAASVRGVVEAATPQPTPPDSGAGGEVERLRAVVQKAINLVRRANTIQSVPIPTGAIEILELEDAILAIDAEAFYSTRPAADSAATQGEVGRES